MDRIKLTWLLFAEFSVSKLVKEITLFDLRNFFVLDFDSQETLCLYLLLSKERRQGLSTHEEENFELLG